MHNYYGERLFILNYQLSIINCAPQSALGVTYYLLLVTC